MQIGVLGHQLGAAKLPGFLVELEFTSKNENLGRKRPLKDESEHGKVVRDHRRTVLMYGQLRELALYRADVLTRDGFNVIIPATHDEVLNVIRSREFHVAILSYTLPSNTVKELADLIRQERPACILLTIAQAAKSDSFIQPDAIVEAELGPEGLLRALRKVLRTTKN